MQLTKCPVCHSPIDLLSLVTDDDARELLAEMLKHPQELNKAVLMYLTLFQPAKTAMSWRKTLRLYKEVIVLGDSHNHLQQCLGATFDQLIAQRQRTPGSKPLAKHNYLIRVLETNTEVQHAISTKHSSNSIIDELTDLSWMHPDT